MTDTMRGSPAPPKDAVEPAALVERNAPRRLVGTVLIGLAIVAVFAGAAFGYSLTRPAVYGAEAQVLLTPRPEMSDNAVDRAMLTQTLVVVSPSVLQPVADRTGIPLDRLEHEVVAGMVNRSNILRVTVADRDRDRAVTLAQLVVVEYMRVTGGLGTPDTAPLRLTVLTPARQLDHLVQPQPWHALAGGTLVGLLVGALVVLVLRRPGRAP